MRPVNTNIYMYIYIYLTEQCLVKKSFPSEKKCVFSSSMQRLLRQRVYKGWFLKDPSLFAEPAAVSKTPPALDAWKGNLLAQLININKITLTLNQWYNWVLVFKSKKHVFGKNMRLMDIFGTNTVYLCIRSEVCMHLFRKRVMNQSSFLTLLDVLSLKSMSPCSFFWSFVPSLKRLYTCSVVSGRFLCPGLINLP